MQAKEAKEKEEQDRLLREQEHKAAEALALQFIEQDRLHLEQEHKAAEALALQAKEAKEKEGNPISYLSLIHI